MAASGKLYVEKWVDNAGATQRACTAQADGESQGTWDARHAAFVAAATAKTGLRGGTTSRIMICVDGLVLTYQDHDGAWTDTPTVRGGGESDADLADRHIAAAGSAYTAHPKK